MHVSCFYCSIKAAEEEYDFVQPLPLDYQCPVTFELLLQPHLTLCCGNHILAKNVKKLQDKEKQCPCCGTFPWGTVLNQHFQRQVRALKVFCPYKDRGCLWQGELYDYDKHAESCDMEDAQLLASFQTILE